MDGKLRVAVLGLRVVFCYGAVVLVVACSFVFAGWAEARSSGGDCSYAADQGVDTYGVNPNVVVYADTSGGGGTSGQADGSGGVCVDFDNLVAVWDVRQDGGTVEAGVGKPAPDSGPTGGYVVFDWDDDNEVQAGVDNTGYVGASSFETGTAEGQGDCWASSSPWGLPAEGEDQGYGSNSGGCVTVTNCSIDGCYYPIVSLPVPLVMCGGGWGYDWQWENSGRDGCRLPERN